MRRRRLRTIQVARLDRLMAEAEAIKRAVEAGARKAHVQRSRLKVDEDGRPVGEVVLRIVPTRRGDD
jgi:tRNA threonylcarbamoyladenosine modification (KEOPS) complex  Pcc1 subunit